MDVFFTVVFAVEALLKIMVLGFVVNGPSSYLRQAWNALDFFIVIVGILVVTLESLTNPSYILWLRSFRAMRALRPLRAARNLDGIRVVVMSMVKSIPAISDVILVAALFYYIFAVLGLNLMCGLYLGCYSGGVLLDPYYLVPPDQNINRSWCEIETGVQTVHTSYYHHYLGIPVPEWTVQTAWGANGVLNRFDNAIMSLWVVFQMSSLVGWSLTTFQGKDVTSKDEQPLFNNNIFMALFFVAYIVLGVLLTLNMVIGVAINTFKRIKEESGSNALLTESQQEWINLQRMMAVMQLKKKYAKPDHPIRRLVFKCVMTETFDQIIMVVILTNIVAMFFSWEGQDSQWVHALICLNAAFSGIFILEMLLKWTSIGFVNYFTDSWCRFDFVVVLVCIVGVVFDFVSTADTTIVTLLRVLRVLRIFKLIPKARGLKLMITAMMWSLPALLNVACVLLLFMYIFAIVGMNLFGQIKWQANINYDAYFESFPTSMLLLFRMLTGENWNLVMTDCMVKQSCLQVVQDVTVTLPNSSQSVFIWRGTYLDADDNTTVLVVIPPSSINNRCTPLPIVAALYFCFYIAVCLYLVIQLIIAIIIDNMADQTKLASMAITQKHFEEFCDTWEEMDATGTGFIDAASMRALLLALEHPLGVKERQQGGCRASKDKILQILELVSSVSIPLRNMNQVHFLETLHALTGRVAGVEVPDDHQFTINNKPVEKLPKDENVMAYSLAEYYAALYVKSVIKGFLIRRKLQPLFHRLERELSYEPHNGGNWTFEELDELLDHVEDAKLTPSEKWKLGLRHNLSRGGLEAAAHEAIIVIGGGAALQADSLPMACDSIKAHDASQHISETSPSDMKRSPVQSQEHSHLHHSIPPLYFNSKPAGNTHQVVHASDVAHGDGNGYDQRMRLPSNESERSASSSSSSMGMLPPGTPSLTAGGLEGGHDNSDSVIASAEEAGAHSPRSHSISGSSCSHHSAIRVATTQLTSSSEAI
ncbi:hypothetical protein CEUSTIGMA_g4444.t1 [Chlamydomonas eustigma]|uniref:Ion transport domain-containing protein n=1 Tax=Chlamydomonas eustigma TaxID=1157962 RepID=A0A250X1N8_9CHLO|nr:hypothetical protein CEUSTIGMA_g4444.t1 [Chlamydomonas eustigma]|eukprot:GAX76997.1 hypothetical protein CEUSTIGMA_g4444.t1 [Chlamydomonas eustigma]